MPRLRPAPHKEPPAGSTTAAARVTVRLTFSSGATTASGPTRPRPTAAPSAGSRAGPSTGFQGVVKACPPPNLLGSPPREVPAPSKRSPGSDRGWPSRVQVPNANSALQDLPSSVDPPPVGPCPSGYRRGLCDRGGVHHPPVLEDIEPVQGGHVSSAVAAVWPGDPALRGTELSAGPADRQPPGGGLPRGRRFSADSRRTLPPLETRAGRPPAQLPPARRQPGRRTGGDRLRRRPHRVAAAERHRRGVRDPRST